MTTDPRDLIDAALSRIDTTTPNGKTRAVEALYPAIALTNSDYLEYLAEGLDISLETLKASLPRKGNVA